MVWEANNLKGFVTEMEATAMLKLAKDWGVEKELVNLVVK
jgi:uridine phosphorylase